MAADGRIVIDVILEDGQVARGVADINGQFDDLDRNGNSRLASVGAGIKKVASIAAIGATAVVGIGAAIGGLAAPLVKAAAEADALNAQFEQVFGKLQKSAQSSVDELGNAFGMLPDRIKPMFTKTTSQFRGLGLDVEEAMKKAEQATSISANAAAFFDVSMESAGDSLNSFIKGNYEGGEAIGVFANETQLASFAVKEGLVSSTKEWANLDEATKQATRLDYAEKMLVAAGAIDKFGEKTGQASRESDSLENQLGNLKQAWENLKALLGAPILEPAIQGIKWLTEVIQSFDPAPFIGAFELLKTGVSTAIDYIKSYVQAGLENLKEFWSEHGTSIVDTVKTAFDTVLSVIQSVLSVVVPFIQEQLSKIQQFWSQNGEQILQAVTNAFNAIKAVIEFVMPAIKFLIETVWTAIKQVITGALDVIMGAVKIFSGLFTGDFSKMWEGIKQLFKGAIDVIIGWMTLSFVGGLKTLLANLAKSGLSLLKGMWDDIAKVFTDMGSKVSGFASEMATKVGSYFTNLLNNAKNIFGTLKTFGESTWNSLKQVVVRAAKQIWDDVVTNFTGLLNSVKTTMNTVKTTVSDIWGSVMTFFRNIDLSQIGKNIIQGLINGIGSMASAVWDKAKSIADGVKKTIQSALDIHSPSRWMRDFVAGNMAKGFVIGIDKNEGLIAKASEKLGDLVKPTIVNPLRGVRANIGNLTTRPSVNQSSSNISNDNRRSFAPQIINHFTPAQSTPSEAARKQEQLLRRLAMEY